MGQGGQRALVIRGAYRRDLGGRALGWIGFGLWTRVGSSEPEFADRLTLLACSFFDWPSPENLPLELRYALLLAALGAGGRLFATPNFASPGRGDRTGITTRRVDASGRCGVCLVERITSACGGVVAMRTSQTTKYDRICHSLSRTMPLIASADRSTGSWERE
jgi:hypothetical protein